MLTSRHLSKSARVPMNRHVESSSEDDSQVDNDSDSSKPETVEPYRWNSRDTGKLKINNKSFTVICEQDKMATPRPPVLICILNCKYEVIPRVAKQMGYKIVRPNSISMFNKPSILDFNNLETKFSAPHKQVKEQDLWNICWTDSIVGVDFCRDMRRFQKINHFPGMFEICRKDLLARNLNRMLRLFPNEYNIFPKTWCFPADFGDAFQYSRQHKNKTFILKPDQGSQGRGIWITKNLKEVKSCERMICQLYVNKPLLIDGFKFDLRVYTLVTSTDPLRIYVFNEGLARFATSKYREPSDYNTANLFMHLTNYSVNKHSRMYSSDDELGTKRKISTLNRILATEGYDVAELWSNIDDVIIKTVLSALPMLKHNYSASFPCHDMVQACFELLGVDILIDHKMKPYILEVNHSPSFHCSEPVDKEVKDALIRDTLIMLNLSYDIRKKVMDEDRRRIRDRLLQRIKDPPKENKDANNNDEPSNKANETEYLDKHNNWEQQIQWEESHLGGFRRVMPAPNDKNKYNAFQFQQNQLSVYSETAASKRREECSKQQRIELEEKYKSNQQLLLHFRNQKHTNLTGEDDVIKKRKLKKPKSKNEFKALEIHEIDERDRCTSLAQRDYLLKTCGLLQTIYVNFHRSQLLTESDKRKYKDMFSKLTADNEIKSLPILSSVQSKPALKTTQIVLETPTITLNETKTALTSASTNSAGRNQNWVHCSELQLTTRSIAQLPLLNQNSRIKSSNHKQVTSVVQRHRQLHSDKII